MKTKVAKYKQRKHTEFRRWASVLALTFSVVASSQGQDYIPNWKELISLEYDRALDGEKQEPFQIRKIGSEEIAGVAWDKVFSGALGVSFEEADGLYSFERKSENGMMALIGEQLTPTFVQPHPLIDGAEWTFLSNGEVIVARCKEIGSLEVSGKRFDQVVKVTTRPQSGEGGTQIRYLAPKFGMIKCEIRNGETTMLIFLRKINPVPRRESSPLLGTWQSGDSGTIFTFHADGRAFLETVMDVSPTPCQWTYLADGSGRLLIESIGDEGLTRKAVMPEILGPNRVRFSDNEEEELVNRVVGALDPKKLVGSWHHASTKDPEGAQVRTTLRSDGSGVKEGVYVNVEKQMFSRNRDEIRWKVLGDFYIEVIKFEGEEYPNAYKIEDVSKDVFSYKFSDELVKGDRFQGEGLLAPPHGFKEVPLEELWD